MVRLPGKLSIDGKNYSLKSEFITDRNAGWVRVIYRPDDEKEGNPPIVASNGDIFPLSTVRTTEEEAFEDMRGRLDLCRSKYKEIDKALKKL